ncbi:MAG TPA: DUF92 domain-containing protein [Candidatus Thermoplasmatota archaeon]|nr:DUF92 domain-containing protein [Candidatus Thermoplasmatota archaeon]
MSELLAHALLAIEVAIVAWFAVLAYRKRMLSLSAAGVAFVLGLAIVFSTNVFWLLLIVSFLAVSAVATRYRYDEKRKRGTAEKREGVRRIRNVLANGLAPTLVAVAAPTVIVPNFGPEVANLAFVTAIAVAAADTLASEIGSLSDRVYMITTGRPVPPGTDGGVSPLGQAAALAGAGIIAALGLLFLGVLQPLFFGTGLPLGWQSLAIPVLIGFLGCQIDSVLGAFFELKGLINKEEVNILAITLGAVVALAWGVSA